MIRHTYILICQLVGGNTVTNEYTRRKEEIIKNLYLSGMPEEFIAMQMDLEIPVIIGILQEIGVYEMSKHS
ncbi:MAG TPA: hypothetical protein VF220_06900 [Nitrososphaeraceae archaeon]